MAVRSPTTLGHPDVPVPLRVPVDGDYLVGDFVAPADRRALVLFAHGSGSGRLSPRNGFVARQLEARGLATLLIDLLTPTEEIEDQRTSALRFDIDLLSRRLGSVIDWVGGNPDTTDLPVGLFGASTGAAAALSAAAERPGRIAAIVSRGGRPDLAGGALPRVDAPTLLLVGGDDTPVIGLNQAAAARMQTTVRLEVVPGATHLFEEPGALERVAVRAGDWFLRYLPAPAPRS
jgi:putative phosphoribosyl transferase